MNRCESFGMSQTHVARRANICTVHLGEVERGKSSASADVLEDVAVALPLDVAEVLCAFRVVPTRAAAAFFDAGRMRAALTVTGEA